VAIQRWARAAILAGVSVGFLLAGCAGQTGRPAPTADPVVTNTAAAADSVGKTEPGRVPEGPKGNVQIDVTDVLGNDAPAYVEFHAVGDALPTPFVVDVPSGRSVEAVPVGSYTAYVYIYTVGTCVMVDAQPVEVREGDTSYVLVQLLEGASGNRFLPAFDRDCDGAIDRVEVQCGTDPEDGRSVPGEAQRPFDTPALSEKAGWYRGELHAHSVYGDGTETVAKLVARAEKAGLDFLAITDRNTLAAASDPGFRSGSVVLIPAMEWGDDERGVALIFGPATMPRAAKNIPQAQAVCNRVQAQGGVFAVAHPCFPNASWRWGLGYVNAIEVWCRGWRDVPPMWLGLLDEDLQAREEGKLVLSIAAAAATTGLSANGQAAVFWDHELMKGLHACAIGGSNTRSPSVPMAQPVTYVYAEEKSVRGILDGLRQGRTVVSSGISGPRLSMMADALDNGTIDVNVGGAIPLYAQSRLHVSVEGGLGAKLEILRNGYPIVTKTIESNTFTHLVPVEPEYLSVFRARVVDTAQNDGFGPLEMLAMTSPIYALDITKQIVEQFPSLQGAYVEVRPDPHGAIEVDPRVLSEDAASRGQIIPKWER